MRAVINFVFIFFITSLLFSQPKKYLISPNQEVIPVGKETTKEIMDRYNRSRQQATSSRCTNYIGGYDPARFPIDQNIGFYHKDVCGQWYVVPADGTIDTVYFHTLDQVGPAPIYFTMDSTINFRIFTSNITPTSGPGVRPGPYHPPCTSWGYYQNTNDAESGIASFVEDATPPQQSSWVPTNIPPSGVDSVPSFPPFGAAIWGMYGYPVYPCRPNTDIKVVMSDLSPLTVHRGDVIFIAFKIPISGLLDNRTQDTRFEIGASDQNVPYPSRDWKFYEHDSEPTPSCGDLPSSQIKRGWVARGSFYADDSLAGTVYDIWYSMTPTSNTPPVISSVDGLGNTLSTGPQKVTCTIYDCDAFDASQAGVKGAYIRYSEDMGESWFTIPIIAYGIDQFEANLPGMNPTNTMDYKIVAEDSSGLADSSFIYSYKVVELNSTGWYRIDTSVSCTPAKIANIGTAIDTSQWFIAPRSFSNPTKPLRSEDGMIQPVRGDDGTAGPFPIAGGFVFYGDTMHYAWVGINGAIALSKTATDTIDLNAGGFWTGNWDFPSPQHHNRSDTLHDKDIPKAFIAPYWADWINKQDSPLATFGHVRYKDDPNKFVVEWDSLGEAGGWWQGDIDAFRVVLNKTDYSIEFQYDEIGYGGLDTLNLTGIQCDSNYHPQPAGQYPPFAFYNKNGYPSVSHLHNGLCVKYWPVSYMIGLEDGWNLLCLPAVFPNDSVSVIFPCSTGPAFIIPCDGGYTPSWTVATGQGFWLKMSGSCAFEVFGRLLTHLDIPVCPGWNIIGSLSVPVPVSNITADAPTGIGPGSTFFSYSSISGYNSASTITPGLGYWVRSNATGLIHLSGTNAPKTANPSAELSTLNKITISQNKSGGSQTLYIGSGSIDPDKYQMPPRAPEGAMDVRFASNRMVEIYPSTLEDGKKYEYPITISATQYPLTIRWEESRNSGEQKSLILKTEDGKVLASLNGSGKITLNDASVKKLIVAVNAGIAIPKVFALGRNYPNPFNPVTRFSVDVPRTSQVEVSVYDVLGRKIVTLWNGEESAGYHTMEWDGLDGQGLMAPTGMYFIRMNVPDEKFSAVQKIMLMK